MAFFQQEQKKIEPKTQSSQTHEKVTYDKIKRCTLKRELGEISEECKKVFQDAGIQD